MIKIKLKKKNFLSKFLIKLLRKLGYEIIDQYNLEIPNNKSFKNNQLSNFNNKDIVLPLGSIKIKENVNSLLILLRTFTKKDSLLSQNKKRIFEEEKKEYSFRSLNSLTKSLNYVKKLIPNINLNLKIIDDNSDFAVIDTFKKILKKNNFNSYEIINLEPKKYYGKMKFNNIQRMLDHNAHIFSSKEIAISSEDDLIYFVEDDYLHEEKCIYEMILTYQRIMSLGNDDIVLLPCDYPYLYQKTDATFILIGKNNHWRRVNESLCTYLISRKALKKYWSFFDDMMTNNYDPFEKPLHDLYKKINCYSPMPSLAIHMANINSIYGISPLIDIKQLWNSCDYKE